MRGARRSSACVTCARVCVHALAHTARAARARVRNEETEAVAVAPRCRHTRSLN